MKIILILVMWAAVLGVYWKLTSREPLNAPQPAALSATLDILLDGPDLFIDFDVPAMELLGFEHAPVNSDEHDSLVEAHRMLDSGMMTIPAIAAQCTLTESFATVGHGYDDLCSVGTTSPMSKPFSNDKLKIRSPVAILPATDSETVISARWAWVCEHPAKLDKLEVHLFEIFSELQNISITTNGTLTAGETKLIHALERQFTEVELNHR